MGNYFLDVLYNKYKVSWFLPSINLNVEPWKSFEHINFNIYENNAS